MATTNLAYVDEFAFSGATTAPSSLPQAKPKPSARPNTSKQRHEDARKNLRVVPGQAREQARVAAILTTTARMACLIIVVIAALSFARIMLNNMAVSTMLESDVISSDIAKARSESINLEMEQSVLSSSPAIKAQAKRLGMTTSGKATTITLAPDVVAIQNGDTLSLSDTIKNVVDIKG